MLKRCGCEMSKKKYIRFGYIPPDFKSKYHRGDAICKIENGVSVWDCVIANGIEFPIMPDNPNECCIADYFNFLFGNKKVFVVTGTELEEKGSCGEPLLGDDIKVIKEITNDYEYLKKIHTR